MPVNNASEREVKQWIRMVEDTTREIENGIADFAGYSETYADMRNKCSDAQTNGAYNKTKADDLKEAVDEAYGRLVKVKAEFCNLKAGGGRARKTRRNRRN